MIVITLIVINNVIITFVNICLNYMIIIIFLLIVFFNRKILISWFYTKIHLFKKYFFK